VLLLCSIGDSPRLPTVDGLSPDLLAMPGLDE
jgi:hypothetical protein